MSTSRLLSDQHASMVASLDRLVRERKRLALKRSVLESCVALSTAITESAMAQDELTDELQALLGAVLARQAVAHTRLVRRARAEEWLDAVLDRATARVTEEVLT
jgi:hypothetical protein